MASFGGAVGRHRERRGAHGCYVWSENAEYFLVCRRRTNIWPLRPCRDLPPSLALPYLALPRFVAVATCVPDGALYEVRKSRPCRSSNGNCLYPPHCRRLTPFDSSCVESAPSAVPLCSYFALCQRTFPTIALCDSLAPLFSHPRRITAGLARNISPFQLCCFGVLGERSALCCLEWPTSACPLSHCKFPRLFGSLYKLLLGRRARAALAAVLWPPIGSLVIQPRPLPAQETYKGHAPLSLLSDRTRLCRSVRSSLLVPGTSVTASCCSDLAMLFFLFSPSLFRSFALPLFVSLPFVSLFSFPFPFSLFPSLRFSLLRI